MKAVAQAVHDSLRETDGCGRLGGEEFFCIFPHASQEAAWQCAGRIRQAVAAAEVAEGDATVQVTISIGLAYVSDVHLGWEDLLAHADEALYKAKAAGRDRIMAL